VRGLADALVACLLSRVVSLGAERCAGRGSEGRAMRRVTPRGAAATRRARRR